MRPKNKRRRRTIKSKNLSRALFWLLVANEAALVALLLNALFGACHVVLDFPGGHGLPL